MYTLSSILLQRSGNVLRVKKIVFSVAITDFNCKNKNKIIYICVASVINPIIAQNNGETNIVRMDKVVKAMEINEEFTNESESTIDVGNETKNETD